MENGNDKSTINRHGTEDVKKISCKLQVSANAKWGGLHNETNILIILIENF